MKEELYLSEIIKDDASVNELYNIFVQYCQEDFMLVARKSGKIIFAKDSIKNTLHLKENQKINQFIEPEELKNILNGETIDLKRDELSMKVNGVATDKYIWLFIINLKMFFDVESMSQNLLELNSQLIQVFNQYGDDSLMVVDGNGILEFAGDSAVYSCGTPIKELIGKSVYDLERDGVFYPSVSVKVLETKKPQAVIQKTKIGEERISVGSPLFDDNGAIKKVLSVTRDYSPQIKISKIIAELNESIMVDEVEDVLEDDHNFITCDGAMMEIKTLIKMVAPTNATVLINGETGTGKEVIARYVHSVSNRKHKPFIKVNCGTISHSIGESELFGYEEGSFTGASKGGKIGLIEAANGGTLFLDEISELPLEQQVMLLRVLQEKEIIKVGGTNAIDLDIRIVAATNKDLEEEVEKGNFREDLFYRLNVIPITLPALRNRKEDIQLLAKHFFKRCCLKYNKVLQLSSGALNTLGQYSWPGNIRQLENSIERIVLTARNPVIRTGDIQSLFQKKETEDMPIEVKRIINLEQAVRMMETELITMAMEEYGTTVKTAEVLGINQSTVSRKIAQYGITRG